MASQKHEILVDLFRRTPGFALERLRAMGMVAKATLSARPRVVESTFPVPSPDYHVDLAIACGGTRRRRPALIVLLEVQLKRDPKKLRTWPLYQAAAAARFKCHACVVVVTLDKKVEAWAATPVSQGPSGSVFRALVLGPAAVRSPVKALERSPELALLAALCHGRREPKLIRAAIRSFAGLESDRRKAYFDFLQYYLSPDFERVMEAMMATSEHKYFGSFARRYYGEGQAKGEAKGLAKGEAKGIREALLTLFAARGIALSDEDRKTITACSDLATLNTWVTRAAHAATASDVFKD